MLKAIETRYKGFRFRSRLEARWAVFFDALGIAWGYEVEGFDLGAQGWYLPDFQLHPPLCFWIEIKPNTLGKNILHDDYWPLLYSFSEQMAPIVAVVGSPGDAQFYVFRDGHVVSVTDYFPLRHFGHFNHNDIDRAVSAARSARFEHGERP